MARFYLDEDISRDVARILVQHAHDVAHAIDLGNRSMSDPAHLRFAAETGRVLITFNRRDFRNAHQLWVALNAWGNLDLNHAGILTPWGQISNVQWAYLVHAFVSRVQNLDNQMWEWRRQQQEWARFGW